MSRTTSRATHLFRRNEGQAMPEYALVLAMVASGSALLFAQLGGQVTAVLMQVTSYLH
jgi:Flp pilus assembly pilin Flp